MKNLAQWKEAIADVRELQAANKVLISRYSHWWNKWLHRLDIGRLEVCGGELQKAEELALKRIRDIESNVFKIGSIE